MKHRKPRTVTVEQTADYKIERWLDDADFAAFVADVKLVWRYLGSRATQAQARELVNEVRFDNLALAGAHVLEGAA